MTREEKRAAIERIGQETHAAIDAISADHGLPFAEYVAKMEHAESGENK